MEHQVGLVRSQGIRFFDRPEVVKHGLNRQAALFPTAIDDIIPDDNVVRLIDQFVDHLNLGELGFSKVRHKGEGRPRWRGLRDKPPYHPGDLLKLYIYGYLHPVVCSNYGVNRYRSSRELERECQRNVELMWLLCGLHPVGLQNQRGKPGSQYDRQL